MNKGTQLSKLFDRIIKEIPEAFELEPSEMPYFVDSNHLEYEGEDTIVLGDDTAITYVSFRKFKIVSMTEALFMPFEATSDGVLEFYRGIWDAYKAVMVDDKSPSYQRGFMLTITEIVRVLEIHRSQKEIK